MLTIQGLYKSFDGFMAVAEAHLEVRQGEIVAVIGPNGAGKTTLFHLITGQLTPDRGTIAFKGQTSPAWPHTKFVARASADPIRWSTFLTA